MSTMFLMITVMTVADKRGDSDGSKDSSLDSGTDTRYGDKRRDLAAKQVHTNIQPNGLDSIRIDIKKSC